MWHYDEFDDPRIFNLMAGQTVVIGREILFFAYFRTRKLPSQEHFIKGTKGWYALFLLGIRLRSQEKGVEEKNSELKCGKNVKNDFYRSTGLPVTIVKQTEIEKKASCL